MGNRLLGDWRTVGHDPPRDESEIVCWVRLGGVLRHYKRRWALLKRGGTEYLHPAGKRV